MATPYIILHCRCGAGTFNTGGFNAVHNGGACAFGGKGADGNGGHYYQPIQQGMYIISHSH